MATEITVKITVDADVSPESVVHWVFTQLNMPGVADRRMGSDLGDFKEEDVDTLDALDGDVEVQLVTEVITTEPSEAEVSQKIADAEHKLRRLISFELIEELGLENQVYKVVEELAELSAALVQYRQDRRGWDFVAKEVADVLTVIGHVPHIVASDGVVGLEKFGAYVRSRVRKNWEDLADMLEIEAEYEA